MTGDEASALHVRALRSFKDGRVVEAISLLTPALTADDGDGAVAVRRRADLAVMHAAHQDWPAARAVLAPVLAALAPQAIAVYLVASTLLGDARGALDDLQSSGNTGWIDHVDAVAEYGRTCAAAGLTTAAEKALTWVLARVPDHGRARDALAQVCVDTARSDEGVRHWQLLVEQQPSSPDRCANLAMGLLKVGRVDEAHAARERAEALGPTGESLSQMLYLHLFDDRATGTSVRATYERAAAGPAVAPALPASGRSRNGESRLRVGFLSSEFDSAPATFFLTPLLDAIDRDRCRVVRYNSGLTSRAPATTPHADDLWRNLPGSDDESLQIIGADHIDVLVDLVGCFTGHRRELLVRGAAPVQAAYPNYPGTTGIATVHWFLSDRWLTPPGTESDYSERVYRLQGGALRYRPPARPGLSPRDDPGRPLTFGLFQRAVKYSGATWDLVAGALCAVPEARLLVHSSDVELDVQGSALRRRIQSQLAARDVDATRVAFVGGRPIQAHLALVGTVDVALDTYPFSGQTTAMECLWMGVPIVSRRGSLHASRVSGALMAQVGLEGYVADDDAGYVRAACALAADVERRRAIQRGLRSRMIDAGLTDGTRLARELEDALASWMRTPTG